MRQLYQPPGGNTTPGLSGTTGMANSGTAKQMSSGNMTALGIEDEKLKTLLFMYGLKNPKAASTLKTLYGLVAPAKVSATQQAKVEDQKKLEQAIVGGLERMKKVRESMSDRERAFADLPLVSGVAERVSPSVATYNTTRRQVGTTIMRMFEGGRMSDQDRTFYFQNMPVAWADDNAFNAKMDSLTEYFKDRIGTITSEENAGKIDQESQTSGNEDYSNNPDYIEIP